jgi:hypothetical protein
VIDIQDDFFDIETLQESYDIEFKKAMGRTEKERYQRASGSHTQQWPIQREDSYS